MMCSFLPHVFSLGLQTGFIIFCVSVGEATFGFIKELGGISLLGNMFFKLLCWSGYFVKTSYNDTMERY